MKVNFRKLIHFFFFLPTLNKILDNNNKTTYNTPIKTSNNAYSNKQRNLL